MLNYRGELFYHPLASFCWKALIALYEQDAAFDARLVDFSDPAQRASYLAMAPLGHFPALRDKGRVLVESSIIIEYIGGLIPAANALDVRARDRFFDLEIHLHMQKVVADELRPADKRDPYGVAEARAKIRAAYAHLETWIGDAWACGTAFTLADCAAAPALWYADKIAPMRGAYPNVAAYLHRLVARDSIARVLREAEPFLHMFPGKPD
ncbi:MAG TPA: glutathione S-transferase family protein [Kofleriaceae bacterium]|jgi:glutathione S-transferase